MPGVVAQWIKEAKEESESMAEQDLTAIFHHEHTASIRRSAGHIDLEDLPKYVSDRFENARDIAEEDVKSVQMENPGLSNVQLLEKYRATQNAALIAGEEYGKQVARIQPADPLMAGEFAKEYFENFVGRELSASYPNQPRLALHLRQEFNEAALSALIDNAPEYATRIQRDDFVRREENNARQRYLFAAKDYEIDKSFNVGKDDAHQLKFFLSTEREIQSVVNSFASEDQKRTELRSIASGFQKEARDRFEERYELGLDSQHRPKEREEYLRGVQSTFSDIVPKQFPEKARTAEVLMPSEAALQADLFKEMHRLGNEWRSVPNNSDLYRESSPKVELLAGLSRGIDVGNKEVDLVLNHPSNGKDPERERYERAVLSVEPFLKRAADIGYSITVGHDESTRVIEQTRVKNSSHQVEVGEVVMTSTTGELSKFRDGYSISGGLHHQSDAASMTSNDNQQLGIAYSHQAKKGGEISVPANYQSAAISSEVNDQGQSEQANKQEQKVANAGQQLIAAQASQTTAPALQESSDQQAKKQQNAGMSFAI